jgi:hypothetical protein
LELDRLWKKLNRNWIKFVELDEKAVDTALTADGTKTYILTKKNILIYSVGEGRIIDAIPLEKSVLCRAWPQWLIKS